MTFVEAKTVTKRNRICTRLNSDSDAQIINRKNASPLLLKIHNLTLASVTESVSSIQRCFQEFGLDHREDSLSRNRLTLAPTSNTNQRLIEFPFNCRILYIVDSTAIHNYLSNSCTWS